MVSGDVSCVLPAYNEEACLESTIAEVDEALRKHCRSFEIIVVDDGSADSTPTLLAELATRYEALQLVHHAENRGYAAALNSGFAAARQPLIFFMDADGQFDPNELPLLTDRIEDADIVVGVRAQRSDSAWRLFFSDGYNRLVRIMLGLPLRDVNCAFKLIRAEVLRSFELTATAFCINAELLMKARAEGMRIVEVDVAHRPRSGGRSTVRVLDTVGTFLGLLSLRREQRARGSRGHASSS